MIHRPTTRPAGQPVVALTERGRIRAVLVSLEQRWDGLSPHQQARALELLAELVGCYRRRVPLVGRLSA